MRTPAPQKALTGLLDQNKRFALDAKGTTNHCPMALVALARMGAPDERLHAFFDHWALKYAIVETQAGAVTGDGDWLAHLGNAAAFSALRRHFSESIEEKGAAAVICDVVSRAPFAPATGAFHAIIRLAYGIDAGHAGEMAAGLAAYVAINLPIELEGNGRQAAQSVNDGLAALSARFSGSSWEGGPITAQLKGIAADPKFREALPMPPAVPRLLDDMARAAIELYWQKADFTVLHMVTGMHAVRVLLAALPETLGHQLLASTWPAFCAAYVSVGAPALRAMDPPDIEADWPGIFRHAVGSDNDHVIKMAYTCFEESKRYPGSPYYLAAASRIAKSGRT